MRIRAAYTKLKNKFDEETKEFVDQLIPQELKDLSQKTDRTEEEQKSFNELNDKVNSEYQEYLIQKGLEEVTCPVDDTLTMDEYSEILDVNSDNNVEINGTDVKAADLMEIVLQLFVKEE